MKSSRTRPECPVRTLRILLPLVAVLLAAQSCRTAPPVKAVTKYGIVRAYAQEDAERVAEHLGFGPAIRQLLDSQREGRLEVWVVPDDPNPEYGSCSRRRIEVERSAGVYVLLHELVHWYVHDSPYEDMPLFIEEGLANYLPGERMGVSEKVLEKLPPSSRLIVPANSLDADAREWEELPDDVQMRLIRLGYDVVAGLGMERLRELAARHASPWEYIEEAGIEWSVVVTDESSGEEGASPGAADEAGGNGGLRDASQEGAERPRPEGIRR